MALRHSHSPTIVSRVFISSRCIFVQHHAPSLSLSRSLAALSGHCHLCSLSRVRHATPHISARPFAPRFFSFLLPPPLSLGGTGATIRARNAETAWDKRDAILIGFYLFLPIRFFLKCVANFSRRKWSFDECWRIWKVEMIHALKISRNKRRSV